MIVLSLDASTNKTGVALFKDGQYATHILIDKHIIKNTMERVSAMMIGICETLDKYRPDKVIMEESMMTTNISTVKLLSYIAGAVISWCAQNNVEFQFILPSEWRKKVGLQQSKKIKRDTLKKEAMEAVKKWYGIDVTDDEAESILIGRSAFIETKPIEDDDFDI